MSGQRTTPHAVPTLRIAIVGTGFLARTRARCWERVHGAREQVIFHHPSA